MASTFSPQLRIELIGAGEQAGAWNNTTNTNLGTLIEQAISGVAAVSVSSSSYTLTTANGATDEARSMVLNVTGTPGSAFNVICPTSSKVYIAKNGTTGGFAMTLKTAAGSGITIPNGRTMLLYCDGTNVVNGVNELPTGATLNGEVIATLTGTETLTNKTLTAPKFADGGFIADANGNEMVVFDTVATAVNELTISNAATAGSPAIYATGGDTNINVNLVPKGTGVVQATGVEVATISGTQALSNKTIVSPANVSATTGNAAILAATGPDTDINISVTPKGAGKLLVSGNTGLGTASPDALLSVNGISSFGAGSASAPSIAAFGDLNTGIWFPAANTISISSDGVERFRIGPSGQLGIGGATYGTSGQVLASGGSGAAPSWADQSNLVTETSVATTSGTAQGYTSIPASAKRIMVLFYNVLNPDDIVVQLGISSGYTTTGYVSNSFTQGGASTYTSGFGTRNSGQGANGIMTITNVSGNDWCSSHSIRDCAGGGRISLSGVLDRVRVVGSGGGTFTGGKINIMYE